MEKWKSIGMLLVTLILGILIGALAMRSLSANHMHKSRRGGPVQVMERVINRFAEPSEAQSQKITKILERHDKLVHQSHDAWKDRERTQLDEMLKEVEAELNAEQVNVLREKVKKVREKGEKKRKRREEERKRGLKD